MKSKSLNRNRILRQILPSIFFIVCIALYVGEVRSLPINLIAGTLALLLCCNMFFQNLLLSRILGGIFLFGSCYLVLACYSDIVNEKAAPGYSLILLLLLISIAMSFLLLLGYEKKKQITEVE